MSEKTGLPVRKDIRWKGYDYKTPANYFITIVIHDRLCLLGDVIGDEVVLSEAGQMVHQKIEELTTRFAESEIPFFVVMPNHIHLILQNLGSHHLGDMMRWFKSVTTNNYIHGVKEKGWKPFRNTLWQTRFYDHVIRNQRAYDYIANYILQNPSRWSQDKLNDACNESPDDINAVIKTLEPY